MPLAHHCENCNKHLDHDMRVDSHFCGKACRLEFHGAKRKLERAYWRAVDAIIHITDMTEKQPRLSEQALEWAVLLSAQLSRVAGATYWLCAECGQITFNQPIQTDECPFCGGSKWKIQSPAGERGTTSK